MHKDTSKPDPETKELPPVMVVDVDPVIAGIQMANFIWQAVNGSRQPVRTHADR